MKIFVSWSHERGRIMAQALSGWLPRVVVDARPWMSTQIPRGSIWVTELLDSLAEADACIVCVTSESVSSGWLAFEAGMLSASARRIPVICVCLDLDPGSLAGSPLGFFTALPLDGAGLEMLVRQLGGKLPAGAPWPDLTTIPEAPTHAFDLIFWTPGSTFTVHDTPLADGPWPEELDRIVDSVGERAGLDLSGIEAFRYLDLTAERWIDPPRRLSGIRTDRLAMIHPSVTEANEGALGGARAVSFLLKQSIDVDPQRVRAFALLRREMAALGEAQARFRQAHGRYAAGGEVPFQPAPGATIDLAAAGADGWSAVVTHDLLDDHFAYRVGDGGGQFAGAEEGTLVKVTRG